MYYSITIKGKRDKRNSEQVRLELIFFCTGYNRVPKVIRVTGAYKDWDQAAQSFRAGSKDAEEKNRQLELLTKKYLTVIQAWEEEGVELTPIEWSHYFETGKDGVGSVWRMIDIMADREESRVRSDSGREQTGMKSAASLRALRRSLCEFTKLKFGQSFSAFTFRFLLDYVSFLQTHGGGSVSTRLRELLWVFRFAGETNLVKPDLSVFDCVKPCFEHKKRILKTLSRDTITQIEQIDPKCFSRVERFHIDLFLFCYYAGGLSNIEVSYLTRSAVRNNTLTYTSKSGKDVRTPLTHKAREIIGRYSRTCYSDYLLPVFTHKHNTEAKQQDRMERLCAGVNRTLKKAGRLIGYDGLIVWSSAKAAFIQRMLEAGLHPIVVAQYTGVAVNVVYKYCPEEPREEELWKLVNRALGRAGT